MVDAFSSSGNFGQREDIYSRKVTWAESTAATSVTHEPAGDLDSSDESRDGMEVEIDDSLL